jgi:hypothetical protein
LLQVGIRGLDVILTDPSPLSKVVGYAAIYDEEGKLSGIKSRGQTFLDRVASFMLAISVVMLLMMSAGLLTPPPDTVGSHPNFPFNLSKATLFIALLSSPTICCAIVWPLYIRQKKRGERVFSWLPLVVLASALWMSLVFWAVVHQ